MTSALATTEAPAITEARQDAGPRSMKAAE